MSDDFFSQQQIEGDVRGGNVNIGGTQNITHLMIHGGARYDPQKPPFMAAPLKGDFIPRAEIGKVIGALLKSDQPRAALTGKWALRGAGGYGKTTCAQAVCYDPSIRAKFSGGVLWVQLSETPPDPKAQLLGLLYLLTGSAPDSIATEALKTALNAALRDRPVLLVVDDLWEAHHLNPFLLDCTLLITTRNRKTLPQDTDTHVIDAMDEGDSLALLGWNLESLWQATPVSAELSALAERLGHWTLLLQLVNKALITEVGDGQTLSDAIRYIHEMLTRYGLTAFDDPHNQAQRDQAVKATVQASLNRLKPDQQDRFTQLAIFPEDTDLPFAALTRCWGSDEFESGRLCRRLADLALLRDLDLGDKTIR
ncbi:MAG: NB-ARC domain-containing protein, partial [Anaerolineae bacterium]|nr:NB-ARC domain-containing protein [Anaerolineae bacterium]